MVDSRRNSPHLVQLLLQKLYQQLTVYNIFEDRQMSKKASYYRLGLPYDDYWNMNKDISHHQLGQFYQVFHHIGAGGFGQVYKGLNIKTNTSVAIKVIDLYEIKLEPKQYLKDVKLRLSRTEDQLMQRCDSPNVVKCFDVFLNQDLKFIVMEFCNRGNLEDEIKRRKHIPEREAIPMLKQIINGITELHSKKIAHRDIKCANIFLHNSEVKLGDLGLSKELMIMNDEDTSANTILGTGQTMAPEVLARQKYGLKADIWSVGVIFFHMLFGKVPFNATSKAKLLEKIVENKLLKKGHLKIEGVNISSEAFDFLKGTLEVDQSKRIGWRQLLLHPLFKKEIGVSSTNNPPIFFSQIHEDNIVIQNKREETKEREQTQKLPQTKVILQKLNNCMDNPEDMQQNQQDRIYKEMQENLYKCLRVELICNEIISPIQLHKILDPEERQVIQLMHLLVSRCFYDLDELKSSIIHKKKQVREEELDPSVVQTRQKIKLFYEHLRGIWNWYSNHLTEEQDKAFNKFKDFFTSNSTVKERQKFLLGIPELDFTRRQHIRYTQYNFIRPMLPNIKAKKHPRLKQLLRNYTAIMLSEPSDYKNGDFDAFVDCLIHR